MSHSGPRTGYYLVRPGSSLSHQLGIDSTPTTDTADPFNHGYGADALAFHFNRAGILTAPPAYIVQATPNEFYTRRIGSFIRGQSTLRDVKAFFGQPQRSNAGPRVLSLTTLFKFTTHPKIDPVAGASPSEGTRRYSTMGLRRVT